jgi:pyridoxamine 5'-phosphate oxidase
MSNSNKVSQMRQSYADEGLLRDALPDEPFALFESWFAQYVALDIFEPNAMVVATASKQAAPSQRTVLMKAYDRDGFVFYTNYGSRKSQQIQENDQVSLIFPWIPLHRQVIVEGRASKVSTAESLKYFLSRPRGSQLGAWSSSQSSVISARSVLESKLTEMKNKFKESDVSLPSFWGGYRIKPHRIEFWQGRTHRLHDRFLYTLDDKNDWVISRLSP